MGSGGKVGTGSGGTTGYNPSVCAGLSAEYDAAMTAARTCSAGATQQCMQPAIDHLSVCGGCPIFVTDASKVGAIQQMWVAAGCDRPPVAPPCFDGACPSGIADVCVAGADGQGMCSYAAAGAGGTSGGTGGKGGSGGSSGAGGSAAADAGPPNDTCAGYAQKYALLLAAAQSCTVDAAGQCLHPVDPILSVCNSGCTTYVNDATELDEIRQLWDQAGCNRTPAVACPAYRCVPAEGGACTKSNTGGGICSNTYNVQI